MKPSLLGVLAGAVLASGCMVGPDFHPPVAPPKRALPAEAARDTSVADGKGQRFVEGAAVAGTWWRILGCPALDAIVSRAVAANPGLDVARATLRRNQDALRAGYGVFFPQVDARAGASRELYNPAPGTLPNNAFNLFTVSGTVSYTLDVWGGARRQTEVLAAGVDAQRYALAGAYIMLTSNVVDTVIAQAAYRAEIDATQDILVQLREQVRIADAQVAAGTEPYSTVLSLQSQVAATEASLPPLEQKIDEATDLLAALSGAMPADWSASPVALSDLQLPSAVPVSLPSRLVQQRPDILMAEAELHAATAGIGVATAAMLPNVTLSATYGLNNTTVGDLFSAGSAFWNLAGGLTQPIFHGGTLYFQRKEAIDARDEAVSTYRQTVLTAFEQVADTLRGLHHDADAVKAQNEAVDAAAKALALIHANYQAGIGTYLQVLVADTQYLQSKVGYVQAAAQRVQDTVALYVALGGGWWNVPDVVKD